MNSFIQQQRNLISLLAIIILWLLSFTAWTHWITQNPLDERFTLPSHTTLNKEIRIHIPEIYELTLVFERGNTSLHELKTLLGSWPDDRDDQTYSGILIPVRWRISEIPEGTLAASGEIDSLGVTAWSASEVERKIGSIRLPPGRYLFSAEIVHDAPEIPHMNTRLSMQLHPKLHATWQVSLAWWGEVVNFIFVLPVAIIITLVLLWRAVRTCYSVRRNAKQQQHAETTP